MVEKIKKQRTVTPPPTAKGHYRVQHLVAGVWSEGEIIAARNRRTLMKQLGGYDEDGRLVNLKPNTKVRAA